MNITVNIVNPLKAGAFTDETIILPKIIAKDLGYIMITEFTSGEIEFIK